MSEKYYTGRPESNLNSDVGVPLAIFSFNEKMEAAVLETGMDTKGEIHRLENIVRPDVGIITNVGISHIERLGSREAILKEKLCITDFFGPDNTLVINGDNDMLSSCEIKGDFHIVRVGTGEDCDYIISDIKDFGEKGISFCLTHGVQRQLLLFHQ
jgi:UDP-N-acetylmuramyl pentapeptide synthase